MSSLNQIVANRVRRQLQHEVAAVMVEPFDYGNALGVAVKLADGTRHAVRVKLEDDDLSAAADKAAAALVEWLSERP
jgi:hypothetical protein